MGGRLFRGRRLLAALDRGLIIRGVGRIKGREVRRVRPVPGALQLAEHRVRAHRHDPVLRQAGAGRTPRAAFGWKQSAAKALRKLPREIQIRIGRKFEELAKDPRPPDAKTLAGGEGLLHIRAGDYRIVYTVKDRILVVLIVRIGHRGKICRKR